MCLSYKGATVEVGVARGVDHLDVFDRFCGALAAVGFELLFAFGPIRVFINLARHTCSFFDVHPGFIVHNKNISKMEANQSEPLLLIYHPVYS